MAHHTRDMGRTGQQGYGGESHMERQHLPVSVYRDIVRSNQRVPCHAEPVDGALSWQRAHGTSGVLRSDDHRRHCGHDMGGHRFVLLLRQSAAGLRATVGGGQQRFRHVGSAGGEHHLQGLARYGRWHPCPVRHSGSTHHHGRHGLALGTSHHCRLHQGEPEEDKAPSLYHHPAVSADVLAADVAGGQSRGLRCAVAVSRMV